MNKNVFLIPALLIGLSVSTMSQASEAPSESEKVQLLKRLASSDVNLSQTKSLWERGVDTLNAKKCEVKESLKELSEKMESQFAGEDLDVQTTAHGQANNASADEDNFVCN
ncbi:TPA: hypothetical protein RG501_RS12965 [Providencia rettgeri]|nr:hypothetical protein [Providencia rettgeri]